MISAVSATDTGAGRRPSRDLCEDQDQRLQQRRRAYEVCFSSPANHRGSDPAVVRHFIDIFNSAGGRLAADRHVPLGHPSHDHRVGRRPEARRARRDRGRCRHDHQARRAGGDRPDRGRRPDARATSWSARAPACPGRDRAGPAVAGRQPPEVPARRHRRQEVADHLLEQLRGASVLTGQQPGPHLRRQLLRVRAAVLPAAARPELDGRWSHLARGAEVICRPAAARWSIPTATWSPTPSSRCTASRA